MKVKDFLSDCLVVAIFVLFLTFLKPFGMHEISFLYSGAFWTVICFSGYAVYSPTIQILSAWLLHTLPQPFNNAAVRLIISTLVASMVMAFLAPFIINFFFNSFENYWQSLPMSFLASVFIGGIIAGVSSIKSILIQQHKQSQQSEQALTSESERVVTIQNQQVNELINELPLEKRGRLICLQMDDHYLNVVTDKGQHLLLMRFKDALSKLENYDGFQTHRSWWVSRQAVAASKKEGRKLILIMENNLEVPVSQTYLAHAKAALDI
ncbi:hypothetical protein ATS75_06550 [Pseudoalteromonas sp. H105]|nr:hypothetical protein ATS75_06550 [Pseudoalteromonas sp. H105]